MIGGFGIFKIHMTATEKASLLIFLIVLTGIYAGEGLFFLKVLYNKFVRGKKVSVFKPRLIILLHCIAVIGIVCVFYGYFIEPKWVAVNKITIQTEKLLETSLRIVQFSDIHCEKRLLNEKRLVETVNSLNPDIVIFSGDALNTIEGLPLFKETMKGIKAKMGKYAVMGNIDLRYCTERKLYGDTGFKVLDSNSVILKKDGEKFCLSGVAWQYPWRWERVLKNVPEGCLSIFLYHTPDLVQDLKGENVDLYLCGHTHGGQIVVPFYGALITFSNFGKRYESGLYKVANLTMYVNRGIGLEGGIAPRARFFARPEVAVFDIVPKKIAEEKK